jgi:uncharacterized membrane protein
MREANDRRDGCLPVEGATGSCCPDCKARMFAVLRGQGGIVGWTARPVDVLAAGWRAPGPGPGPIDCGAFGTTSSTAMTLLILGLVIFLGIHSVAIVAPSWRDAQVVQRGAGAWKGIYSAVSLAGLVLIVVGYGMARQAPVVLYTPPTALRHVALLLMLPVFPLLFAAYLPGRIRAAAKHPMLAAVKFWALAHLLANGTLAAVLLFGAFLAWAVADRIAVGRRGRAAGHGAAPAAGVPALRPLAAPRTDRCVAARLMGSSSSLATRAMSVGRSGAPPRPSPGGRT